MRKNKEGFCTCIQHQMNCKTRTKVTEFSDNGEKLSVKTCQQRQR